VETDGVIPPTESPADKELREVLHRLGVTPAALLGSGGEASVYALDDDRVVRVLHAGSRGAVEARVDLVNELRRDDSPFLLPEVLRLGSVGATHFVIERRLPGRSVAEELQRLDRRGRDRLINAHLDAAASLGDLHLEPRGWFGDLIATRSIRAATWRAYLVEKVATSLDRAPGFEHIDAEHLSRDLPDCEHGAFVHLDAFAGNMLAVDTEIMAVIDIGETSVLGDRRLDPLSAAVYLSRSTITPRANDADRMVVHAWLRNAELEEWFEPARRWIAGYWAWAVHNQKLHQWCRSVLL
jgi:aminoglycoside phosphotransferase (APT) family kinase protein